MRLNTGLYGAIADLDGNVVASTEWREICARFHRKHPDSLQNCVESDTKLTDGIEPGQFFYDDEKIDYDAFRAQAHKFGKGGIYPDAVLNGGHDGEGGEGSGIA